MSKKYNKRKALALFFIVCTLTALPVFVYAASLEDLANSNNETKTEIINDNSNQYNNEAQEQENAFSSDDEKFIAEMGNMSVLSDERPEAKKANSAIKRVAAIIVQILSYFIVAALVVRVVLDLTYICIPFTRSFLSNGYGAAMSPGQMNGGMPGIGGMGMGGFGGGLGGYSGGYGMNRYGMGGMGGYGNPAMNGGSVPGATPAMGKIQWVSGAALRAVANESSPGPDGKAVSPLKAYAGDMTAMLVLTPILLVLATTGILTQLGLMLGQVIGNAIVGIGNIF